ncbi:MAG: hypothetical protein L3I99_05835, partial [Sulfurimonas sp.]|nr:hypothetical protein [Sulfurimonas sp.]
MKRTSSLLSNNIAVDRSIDSSFDDIREIGEISDKIVIVANNIQAILDVSVGIPIINQKLDTIEENATADQTDLEIKVAYENNTNTNAYTDIDLSKLLNISVSQPIDLDNIGGNTVTNLSYTASLLNGIVESSDGTDATIPLVVSGGNAGLSAGSDKAKLDSIETSSNNYSHPSGDGNLHVPSNGTTNNGKVLTASSVAGVSTWETSAGGFTDPMTTQGDIIFRNASNATSRLPAGLNDQVLTSDGTNIFWNTNPTGVTNHTMLSNIGTNSHAQIDSHIADTNTHFSQSSISITESQISNLGEYLSDNDFTSQGFMVSDGAGNYTVDNSTYSLSAHNHAGVYEPVDADIVRAPSNILPALDGSNLTNLSSSSSDKGTLTHSFLANETVAIPLIAPVAIPIVAITKDVQQTGVSHNYWDTGANPSNYNIEDSAYNTSITPSGISGYIMLTLGAGAFTTTDLRKTIRGNGGEAVLVDINGAAIVIKDFLNTNLIATGDWTMGSVSYPLTGAEISNFKENIPSGGSGLLTFNGNNTKAQEFDNGNIILFSRNGAASIAATRFIIIKRDGTLVLNPSILPNTGPLYEIYRFGSDNVFFFNATTFNIISSTGALSAASNIVNSPNLDVGISGGTLPNGNVWMIGRGATGMSKFEFLDDGTQLPIVTLATGSESGVTAQLLPNGNFMIFYHLSGANFMTIIDQLGNTVLAPTIIDVGGNTSIQRLFKSGIFKNGNVIFANRTNAGVDVLRFTIFDTDGNVVKSSFSTTTDVSDVYKCEAMEDGRIAVFV